MPFSPGVMYLLVSMVLFGVAVVVHFHSSSLSLPLSPVVSILVTLLPILAFLNAYIHPSLLRAAHHQSSSRLRQLASLILQTLQALVTTILATLLFEQIVPSPALDCLLETDWMRMYRNHDETGIRQIQDMMNCCGFNSVKDRAYPFGAGQRNQCADMFGRTQSCRQPWTAALQGSAGADFAIVIAVGLLQIIGLLLMRGGASWWTAWRTRGWEVTEARRESRRPLLPAVPEAEDEETAENRHYGAVRGEETEPRGDQPPLAERNAWQD